MAQIIGREKEQEILREAFHAEESLFVVVYGRRRVGKTFLVREAFADKMDFYATGVNQENKKVQLEAFASLITILESSKSDKKVVFLDELSWMNGGDGSFLTALEWFWNSWASARKDILLICCSSATSWIVNQVFHNHGGLYGRVNRRIHLHPFTLQECERLTKTRKSCQLVMITTYGLQNNQYVGMIQNSLTMDDLFR